MFGAQADASRAAWWLDKLHLDDLTERYPEQLSGGQRQRVSLARALAPDPRLVLLDEPFSALDAPVRHELRRELRTLQREAGLSTVLVTHDPEEAAFLADEILVLNQGVVLQSGSVADVYRRPASLHVARLLGLRNVADGVITADGSRLASGSLSLTLPERLPAGMAVLWSVPPQQVTVMGPGSEASGHRALVIDVIDLGTSVEVVVQMESGLELISRSASAAVTRAGEACLVHLDPDAISVWPAPVGHRSALVTA
jgi:molybdate transport system permease protein